MYFLHVYLFRETEFLLPPLPLWHPVGFVLGLTSISSAPCFTVCVSQFVCVCVIFHPTHIKWR